MAASHPYGPTGTSGPCWLYRYFDAGGQLLYVGITTQPEKRDQNHRSYLSPFAIYIDSRTQVEFSTVNDARPAEWEAIKTEMPIFNVMGGSKETVAAWKTFMADPVNIKIKRDSWRREGMDDESIERLEQTIAAHRSWG